MINVVLYIRVSTEEQAENGFSLSAQEDALRRYCTKNGYHVLKLFRDDYSAWKGFERPGYMEFRKYLHENKKAVHKLVFTQWSRFSRNMVESMREIGELKNLGVEVLAIDQENDTSIPENILLHAINLALPQIENERLSLRTKAGNRQALKEGRYINRAPFGYKYNRITKLLEVEEKNAELIRFAFSQLSSYSYSISEVHRQLKDKGLTLAKQSFINMLMNVIYIGKIVVPAWKDEPKSIVEGLHKPILEESLFYEVQAILNGKKKPYKGLTKSDSLPLMGFLICPKCNRQMTGSASKGNGGLYHYYHCQRVYGCNNAFNASKANLIFQQYLESLVPDKAVIALYYSILEDLFKSNNSDREKETIELERELVKIDERIKFAIGKNLDGIWDDETFKLAKKDLDEKRNDLNSRLNTLKKLPDQFSLYLSYSTALIADLGKYYGEANVNVKKKIVGSIFPENLYFDGQNYRTTKVNQFLSLVCKPSKALNKNSHAKSARLSSLAPPSGLEPETL